MGIQIGGMASGFDTTSMVQELMKAESTRVDKLNQQKSMVQFQKEAYIAINDKYSSFILNMRKTFGIDNYIATNGLTRPGALTNLSWMNKATSSNESIVSAKPTSGAKPGNYELNVKQLADNFKAASEANVSVNKDGANLAESLGIDGNTMIDISITDSSGNVVSINQTADSLTLSDLANELNKVEGLTVEYDKALDRFFIKTDKTGSDNQFTITDNTALNGGTTDGLLDALKLTSDGVGLKSGSYSGKNAIIDFNGATNLEFSSNNFNIQGIDYNIKSLGTSNIIVDTDVDSVVEKVGVFVEEYNKLVKEIGDLLVEPKYRDFPPLTDAQKKEMSEKEIELWESKTKSGLIRNDSMVNKVQQQLREALLMPITLSDGTKVSLSDFGIEGKGYFEGGKNGELKIDEAKLKSALTEKPEQFLEVMFGTPSDPTLNKADKDLSPSEITAKREQCGIFHRISDVMVSGMSQIINKAGIGSQSNQYREVNSFIMVDFTKNGSQSLLDKSLLDFNKRIDTMNIRLTKIENRYWKQFTAMEKALTNMQSQQSIFSSF